MLPYVLIAAVLALTVYFQLMMKARAVVHAPILAGGSEYPRYLFAMFTDIGVLSALLAGLIAGACWMVAIGRLNIGYAYPFIALTFVLVPIGSSLLFNEPLSFAQFCGLALIVAGVSISALAHRLG